MASSHSSTTTVDSTVADKESVRKADHLCILVHGLWGKPEHMSFVASALRERHQSRIHILIASQNSGNQTYDGIELGGERVTLEVEEKLEELARTGHKIRKISVVGYSLGGLIARYAVGLLYSKGWFERLQAVNFTTFATPHLGVRTPHRGIHNHLWNVLGARTLSISGRQLFLIDSFRQTNRPLLSLLADPESIFMRGLAGFKTRSLYANVINDRSTVFYTSYISRTDPFDNLDDYTCNYLPGYSDVIIDPASPVTKHLDSDLPTSYQRAAVKSRALLTQVPLGILIAVVVPIAASVFLINSAIQSYLSSRRIKLVEGGGTFMSYRIPLIADNMQNAVEHAIGDLSGSRENEYLPPGSEEAALPSPDTKTSPQKSHNPTSPPPTDSDEKHQPFRQSQDSIQTMKSNARKPQFPTLALAPLQFEMINALDSVGFRKYPVYIHKARHSHAAIICRRSGTQFDEGAMVAKHWLDTEFSV